jgi:hypothetical protein
VGRYFSITEAEKITGFDDNWNKRCGVKKKVIRTKLYLEDCELVIIKLL